MKKKQVNEKCLRTMLEAVSEPDDQFYGLVGDDAGTNLVGNLLDAKGEVAERAKILEDLQSAVAPDKERVKKAKADLRNAKRTQDKATKDLKKAVAKARLVLDATVAAFAKLEAAVTSGNYEVVED